MEEGVANKETSLAVLLEVGDDIVTLALLLEAVEGHLGSRNVFLQYTKGRKDKGNGVSFFMQTKLIHVAQ